MQTDFDTIKNKDLFAPVVFRADFNQKEPINTNQAWSLFFTAGQEDKALGFQAELGNFFTNTLIAVAVTGAVYGLFFTNVL